MTPARVLGELAALAGRLGVEVRAEAFGKGVLGGRGGLCWVDGKPLVVMDEKLGLEERIAVLAEALAKGGFDLEAATLAPQVRERIEAARGGRGAIGGKAARRPAKKRAEPGRPGLARARPRGR